MDYTVKISFNLSFLAFVSILLIGWGGFRGYKIGGVIMAVSVFALTLGTFIAAEISDLVYRIFITTDSVVPEIFGSITLVLTFSLVIWLSNLTHAATIKRVTPTQNDSANRRFGIFLGMFKFFIITGVYITAMLNLDCRGHFLPASERYNFWLHFQRNTTTHIFRSMRMDRHLKENPCYSDYTTKKQRNNQQNNQQPNNKQQNDTTKNKKQKPNTSLPVE